MILIVGLGNPGQKYAQTRHNLGFMVLDHWVRKKFSLEKSERAWRLNAKLPAVTCQIQPEVLLVKPQTMMNASGHAVEKLLGDLGGLRELRDLNNLWVIHDDLDLALGRMQIVKNRGSAGHRGVTSVIEELGTADFIRFRLGIGEREGFSPKISRPEKFVLEEFLPKEKEEVKKMLKKTVAALEAALGKGVEEAMKRFN